MISPSYFKRDFKNLKQINVELQEDTALLRQTLICKRTKSLTVGDYTIQAEGLSDFFKSLGEKGTFAWKKDGKKCAQRNRKSFGKWSKR